MLSLEDYGGVWESYIEAVYTAFKNDFIDGAPSFRGRLIGLKKHPVELGKEATFWHLISEGEAEAERTPDLRRCERIRWPKAIIEHDKAPEVKVWENRRKNERRILFWIEDLDYLVVLADRKGYLLLWTAYLTTRSHTKRKLRREYEAFRKANAAP